MNKTIELKLSFDNVNVIMAALGKLPYENVFQVIQDITAQVRTQLNESKTDESTN